MKRDRHMKLKLLAIIFFCLNILKLDADSCSMPGNICISDNFFQSRIEARYSTGRFIGIKQDYGEAGMFAPLYLSDCFFSFLDYRDYRFNNSKWGTSAGIGIRKCLGNDNIAGANIYYDYLEGKFHKSFNRLGLGFEWLGNCWDLRINAYFPLGHQANFSRTHHYDHYVGNFHATCREKEFAFNRGFDAELGLPFWCWDNFTAYGAIGPYYYSARNKSHYYGGQARIEIHYASLITLQVRSSYDHVNHSRTQFQIEISLPFEILCGNINCCFRDLFLQPVRRNGVIFTDHCCNYTWNW